MYTGLPSFVMSRHSGGRLPTLRYLAYMYLQYTYVLYMGGEQQAQGVSLTLSPVQLRVGGPDLGHATIANCGQLFFHGPTQAHLRLPLGARRR